MDLNQPVDARPTTWPTVLGILGLVFGGLATLEGCFGAGIVGFVGILTSQIGADHPIAVTLAGVDALRTELISVAIVTLGLGVLLLVGGASLLRRRPRSLVLWLTWAVLKIVYSYPKASVNMRVNEVQFEAMQSDPNMQMMPMSRMLDVLGPAGMAISIVWTCAFPIFVLVWFLRPKIRTEIRSW